MNETFPMNMPKFEFVPEQVKQPLRRVRAAADGAFLEHAEAGGKAKGNHWMTILDSNQGKFVRTKALFSILRGIVPDTLFHHITGSHYEIQSDKLPIDPKLYAFEESKVGSGQECNVYKLTSHNPNVPSLVIKIDRTGTENIDALVERGKKVRHEWETMSEWYRDIPGLIPEELQFIGHSPIGGRNALITLQEYFGTAGELRDFFRDVSRERLNQLLISDAQFRRSIIIFAQVTLQRAEEHDQMIDTIGENNLIVVERSDGAHLILLDPHVVKHPKSTNVENERREFKRQLTRLGEILAEAEEIETKFSTRDTEETEA